MKLFFPAFTEENAQEVSEAPHQDIAPLRKSRILLVEDQVEVLDILRKSLEAAGHDVTTAESGDEAAEIARRTSAFDLLVTDVVMPGQLQGPGLSKLLRTTTPDLPVIFLSGYASEAVMHGNGLRKQDIRLMKPVARKTLLEALGKALDQAGETGDG